MHTTHIPPRYPQSTALSETPRHSYRPRSVSVEIRYQHLMLISDFNSWKKRPAPHDADPQRGFGFSNRHFVQAKPPMLSRFGRTKPRVSSAPCGCLRGILRHPKAENIMRECERYSQRRFSIGRRFRSERNFWESISSGSGGG